MSLQGQLGVLMSILRENISHMDKDQLSFHQTELTSFFLTALDFRTEHCQVSDTFLLCEAPPLCLTPQS